MRWFRRTRGPEPEPIELTISVKKSRDEFNKAWWTARAQVPMPNGWAPEELRFHGHTPKQAEEGLIRAAEKRRRQRSKYLTERESPNTPPFYSTKRMIRGL